MATTLYLVVSGHGTTEQIDRYLWFGAERVRAASGDLNEYKRLACIVRVTEDDEHDARRRAEAQADRLRSGLYGVLTVDTLKEADRLVSEAYADAVADIVRHS